MTGYRMSVNHSVHLFRECVPHRNGAPVAMESLIIARRFDGKLVRYDPLLNAALTIQLCHRCVARQEASPTAH